MRKKKLSTGETIAAFVILFLKKLSAAAIGIVVIMLLYLILLPCPIQEKERGHARRHACVNNLKQLVLALTMYACENKDEFPPIDNTKNNFMFDADFLYPEYLSDASIVVCPAELNYDPGESFRLRSNQQHPNASAGEVHPDCITDKSYIYLGWEITDDKEAEAFFDIYDKMSPEDYAKDIINPDDGSIDITALSGKEKVGPFFGSQFSSWEETEAYLDSHGIRSTSEI